MKVDTKSILNKYTSSGRTQRKDVFKNGAQDTSFIKKKQISPFQNKQNGHDNLINKETFYNGLKMNKQPLEKGVQRFKQSKVLKRKKRQTDVASVNLVELLMRNFTPQKSNQNNKNTNSNRRTSGNSNIASFELTVESPSPEAIEKNLNSSNGQNIRNKLILKPQQNRDSTSSDNNQNEILENVSPELKIVGESNQKVELDSTPVKTESENKNSDFYGDSKSSLPGNNENFSIIQPLISSTSTYSTITSTTSNTEGKKEDEISKLAQEIVNFINEGENDYLAYGNPNELTTDIAVTASDKTGSLPLSLDQDLSADLSSEENILISFSSTPSIYKEGSSYKDTPIDNKYLLNKENTESQSANYTENENNLYNPTDNTLLENNIRQGNTHENRLLIVPSEFSVLNTSSKTILEDTFNKYQDEAANDNSLYENKKLDSNNNERLNTENNDDTQSPDIINESQKTDNQVANNEANKNQINFENVEENSSKVSSENGVMADETAEVELDTNFQGSVENQDTKNTLILISHKNDETPNSKTQEASQEDREQNYLKGFEEAGEPNQDARDTSSQSQELISNKNDETQNWKAQEASQEDREQNNLKDFEVQREPNQDELSNFQSLEQDQDEGSGNQESQNTNNEQIVTEKQTNTDQESNQDTNQSLSEKEMKNIKKNADDANKEIMNLINQAEISDTPKIGTDLDLSISSQNPNNPNDNKTNVRENVNKIDFTSEQETTLDLNSKDNSNEEPTSSTARVLVNNISDETKASTENEDLLPSQREEKQNVPNTDNSENGIHNKSILFEGKTNYFTQTTTTDRPKITLKTNYENNSQSKQAKMDAKSKFVDYILRQVFG